MAAPLPNPALDLSSDQNPSPGARRSAILAGGCFWCIEGVFRQLSGVSQVVSGYAGGTPETADYQSVCTGRTAHAEVVKVVYDPAKITFGQLLRVLFTVIDPTTRDRQGPDSGPQYRSAIFCETDEQRRVAQAYIDQLNAARIFPRAIVTTIEPLTAEGFYAAEAYHQDYVACNMRNPYIVHEALPKVAKVRAAFADAVKPAAG